MGSWNHTCFLTNLPVLSGEEVYVFLLKEGDFYNKYIGHHCYPTNYYEPLPFFFEGNYNDYGGVENCHGPLLPAIIEGIRLNLIEMPLDDNEYHDIEVSKKGLDIDSLFNYDHENRLFVGPDKFAVNNGKPAPIRLTHIVIKKNVLDSFLAKYKLDIYIDKKSKTLSYSQFMLRALKEVETIRKNVTPDCARPLARMLIGGTADKIINYALYRSRDGIDYDIIDGYDVLLGAILAKDEALLEAVVSQLATMAMLLSYMANCRRMWIKPSGVGSQNTDVDAQLLTAKLIKEGASALQQKYKEWENE